MPRDRIVHYLEQFRERNQLCVSFGQAAASVTRGWGDQWVVLTSAGRWLRAPNVVVAAGGCVLQLWGALVAHGLSGAASILPDGLNGSGNYANKVSRCCIHPSTRTRNNCKKVLSQHCH